MTMVVLLGLLGFVIFPRETYFHIVSLELDPNNSTYKDGDQLMTNWLAQVGIFNQNYYPISIRRINLKSYLDHNRNDPVGYGSGENLYFPSRSHVVNSVSFQMPVFAPSTGKPSIIAECMTTDRVDLFITAEMDLSWTHWTGRWIPVEFSASVDCKLPSVLKVMKRV